MKYLLKEIIKFNLTEMSMAFNRGNNVSRRIMMTKYAKNEYIFFMQVQVFHHM